MNRLARRRLANRTAAGVCLAFTLLAIFPLFSVLWEVWKRGHGVVDMEFLTSPPQPPAFPGGGIQHALVGTGIVVGLATLVGAPVGMLAGIFLSEYGRNRLGDVIRTVTDALSGIPSIAAGLFAYAFVVSRYGFSAWAGSVALAILMIPTVTRTTEEALRTVPQSLRDASLALGAPRWVTTLRIVLPAAWGAVLTGLLLGVARIAGETAPLLLTVLTSFFYSTDPTQPVATLQYLIYDYGKSAYPKLVEQAWGAALVLITGVLVLNLAVRLLARSRRRVA
ncbi:MAG TPA: phosphate ABC transporter permease PstA [Candidatus Thermoplasmatota archaeon]|nr:phosphate ABC transporter permease PstA [Candidatus Thermoplasmatota archaeon]